MSGLRYEPGEIAKAKRRQVEILSIEGLERIFCRDVENGERACDCDRDTLFYRIGLSNWSAERKQEQGHEKSSR